MRRAFVATASLVAVLTLALAGCEGGESVKDSGADAAVEVLYDIAFDPAAELPKDLPAEAATELPAEVAQELPADVPEEVPADAGTELTPDDVVQEATEEVAPDAEDVPVADDLAAGDPAADIAPDGVEDEGAEAEGTTDLAGDEGAPDLAADGEEPVPCQDDDDCVAAWGQAPACHAHVCQLPEGFCVDQVAADDDPCQDGLACTIGDRCLDGACVAGTGTCDDGNACTTDGCAEPAGCTHVAVPDQTGCGTGRWCIGGFCEARPVCGDRGIGIGEECDDGDQEDLDGCDHLCQVEDGWECTGEPSVCKAVCGDGKVVSGQEDCDDGLRANLDGCDENCKFEAGWICSGVPTVCQEDCGDGKVVGMEGCDDDDLDPLDGCNADCQVEEGWECTGQPSVCTIVGECGDGLWGVGEDCDDGLRVNGDGCDENCKFEAGFTCTGWPTTCEEICGDRLIVGRENCDDGDKDPTDGCDSWCMQEAGWTCAGLPSVCVTTCGDGIPAGDEGCDDGLKVPGDGCDENCGKEYGWECAGVPSVCVTVCSDTKIAGTEDCDDGDLQNGDGCDGDCKVEPGWTCTGQPSACATTCGDGIPAGDEGCDDGLKVPGDGCDADCKVEPHWLCVDIPSICVCQDGWAAPFCAECLETRWGGACDGTVTCDTANGTCAAGTCYGTAGNGHCTTCNPGYLDDDCTTKVPAVLSTMPADGATPPANTAIVVTFTEPMDGASLTTQVAHGPCTGAIQVSKDGFATCEGFVSAFALLSSGDTVATLVPVPGLLVNRTYRIRVTTAALAADGRPMTADHVQATGFTTTNIASQGGNRDGSVVISQVYGGGGNSGSVYKSDFIELRNLGTTAIDLAGWSVQYASSTGSTWQVTSLAGTIPPGGYFLVKEANGSGGTTDLPTPDVTGTIPMAGVSGKVALVASTTALSGACPDASLWKDLVGYGVAGCYRGTGQAAGVTNTTSAIRKESGCLDQGDNALDFENATPPVPRNTASPGISCTWANNESGAAEEMDLCAIVDPATLSAVPGATLGLVTGEVYEEGWTEADGVNPSLMAQFGVGPADRNPQYEAGWTFVEIGRAHV